MLRSTLQHSRRVFTNLPLACLPKHTPSRQFSASTSSLVDAKKPSVADLLTMDAPPKDDKRGTDEDTDGKDAKQTENDERLNNAANKKYGQRLAKNLRNTLFFSLLVVSGSLIVLGTPSTSEEVVEGEGFVAGYARRAVENAKKWWNVSEDCLCLLQKSAEPIYGPKLLPDPLPAPYSRLATLVVELNDALVHLVWEKDNGWRIAVRPGAKEFLSYLSRYYEIVIFANTQSHIAQPVADTIDPYNMAMYKLYRESTRLVDGVFVKDLDTLNRDLKKVVCVDINKGAYSLHPQNGLHLSEWTGQKGDVGLKEMTTLLEEIAIMMQLAQLEDIRPLLRIVNANNAENPYKGWLDHKQKMKIEFAATAAPPKSTFGSFLRRTPPPPQQTLFDYVEKIASEERTVHSSQMKKEMESMAKLREEGEAKMLEEMKSKGFKMFDYFSGAASSTPPSSQ